jgi:hypothetical protein
LYFLGDVVSRSHQEEKNHHPPSGNVANNHGRNSGRGAGNGGNWAEGDLLHMIPVKMIAADSPLHDIKEKHNQHTPTQVRNI